MKRPLPAIFLLGSLLLCAALWSWSYWHSAAVTFGRPWLSQIYCDLSCGSISLYGEETSTPVPLTFDHRPVDSDLNGWYERLWDMCRYRFLGLAFEPWSTNHFPRWILKIPLWLPAFLAACAAVWLHRRRNRPNQPAFPVEPTTGTAVRAPPITHPDSSLPAHAPQ